MTEPVLLWLRQDLRLADQPALVAAAAEGPVVPVYVLDDASPGEWRIGGAQRWWLHHSLDSLGAALEAKGSRLILRHGRAVEQLERLCAEIGAARIHAIRHYEPWWREAEGALGDRLVLHDGGRLTSVEQVTTAAGTPFKIFSSFWKAAAQQLPPDRPLPAPKSIPAPRHWPSGDTLTSWRLLPFRPDWAAAFGDEWQPGEAGALKRLERLESTIARYDAARNLPSEEGSSRLSPHLHMGEISPATVWHGLHGRSAGVTSFRRELGWRDFTAGAILAQPDYADRNGRARFDALRWRSGKAANADLRAWQRGRTGYPIVDAGMRQLWTTGWMHNRVRMITASFLVKHLLIDWREGERWFWDCLVDADYGNNAINWQWVAGTGTDASMFTRVMAPLTQSAKFDAGDYIRRWVPELAGVPGAAIHDPEDAGVRVADYPAKIIGHREGRERALAAARTLR